MNAKTNEDSALADFTEYFVTNYPPNTIIGRPGWHAPKIFRAAKYALQQAAPEQAEGEAVYQIQCSNQVGWFGASKDQYDRHPENMRRILYTAAPRVVDVVNAAQDLLDACIAEFGTGDEPIEDDDGPMWGDDSKVSYPEETCNITFGHIRRLKAALENTNAS